MSLIHSHSEFLSSTFSKPHPTLAIPFTQTLLVDDSSFQLTENIGHLLDMSELSFITSLFVTSSYFQLIFLTYPY